MLIPMFVMVAGLRADACPRGVACVAAQPRAEPRAAARARIDARARARQPRHVLPVPGAAARARIEARARRVEARIDAKADSQQPRLQLTATTGIPTAAPDPLSLSMRTHRVAPVAGVEMPWIWGQLRQGIYDRLPTYEGGSRQPANKFTLVMSPVVVVTPQDSVPGVGVEGGF